MDAEITKPSRHASELPGLQPRRTQQRPGDWPGGTFKKGKSMKPQPAICIHWNTENAHCKLKNPRRKGYQWAYGRCGNPYKTARHGCKDLEFKNE
jgi:hypothetical protein